MVFDDVRPTEAELSAALPGDNLVEPAEPADPAEVVMDRAFSLAAPPAEVWPWLVQLGKKRAGWYLPRSIERLVPPGRRGLWHLEPAYLRHEVGDVIPDWGGKDATFTLAAIEPGRLILYTSTRGRTDLTWSVNLAPAGPGSRVHLRLRLAPVKHRRVAVSVGGFFDLVTVAGLAGGLAERLAQPVR